MEALGTDPALRGLRGVLEGQRSRLTWVISIRRSQIDLAATRRADVAPMSRPEFLRTLAKVIVLAAIAALAVAVAVHVTGTTLPP